VQAWDSWGVARPEVRHHECLGSTGLPVLLTRQYGFMPFLLSGRGLAGSLASAGQRSFLAAHGRGPSHPIPSYQVTCGGRVCCLQAPWFINAILAFRTALPWLDHAYERNSVLDGDTYFLHVAVGGRADSSSCGYVSWYQASAHQQCSLLFLHMHSCTHLILR
jgi:hypothetical protein